MKKEEVVLKDLLTNTGNERKEINERLLRDSYLSTNEVLLKYNSALDGLNEEQRDDSRREYGKNKIQKTKKLTFAKRLLKAFFDPFTLILIVLACISLITDFILAPEDEKNPLTALIILMMVLLSGVLRFVQEKKSGESSDKLLEMVETTCLVSLKGEGRKEIPIDELVVGDIIHLSSGDMVPADIRILSSKDLFISQGSLTGESVSVEKFDINKSESGGVIDAMNLAFMGTNILSGTATAVVLAVGKSTLFGEIAANLSSKKEITHFEKGINSVSWILIRFMLIMVPIVFFATGITKGHWLNSLIFAITIAVGLTPEMLPMIVTTCLSVGSMEMAKKKVIMKNINSIQSLGAMNILCTDKTGTLTEDKIVLQYHINIEGNEDTKVLRYGFLNSFYQTGLKNLMDKAIISKTMILKEKDENLEANITKFEKIDEVPFDFKRRRMSVVVKGNKNSTKMITKGAVEEIVSICNYVEIKKNIYPITDEIKKNIYRKVSELNKKGMRVIAVAYKTNHNKVGVFSVEDEKDMILIGYLAFLDPPKESAVDAIKALNEHGVDVKVLTGDNKEVSETVCKKLNISTRNILVGEEIEKMSDLELEEAMKDTSVFTKLSPDQKVRIVKTLKNAGNVVGFMGDGINDAAALECSDVGISVSNAVDIAKESADAILLEKDLMVLEDGIIEGRKIYANMLKYIKVTASSNFGNVFSVLVASIFLPFLPMQPLHLLMLNMIYDISCIAFPWDNVDKEYLKKPRRWNADSISGFMIKFGPVSSIFDIATFLVLYFIICPIFTGGMLFNSLSGEALKDTYISVFHSGWFIESMLSQTLVIQMLRTNKKPFIESLPSGNLMILNSLGIIFVIALTYMKKGKSVGFIALPPIYFLYLGVIIFLYLFLISIVKKNYIAKYKEIL